MLCVRLAAGNPGIDVGVEEIPNVGVSVAW